MSPSGSVPTLARARAVLRDAFGHADLRPEQAAVLPRVLAGDTLLVVWPTGGGKSLLYQLPALLAQGPTLVISPLIALMHDQWQALQARGIAAEALHSHLRLGALDRALERLRAGRTRLLYLAPERLRDPRVHHALAAAPHPVARMVVDEAHCITEWGHDFREDYMRIPRARAMLGGPPLLLLTATATAAVQDDIRQCMGVPDCPVVLGDLDRPNLWLDRRHVRSQREKLAALEATVPDYAGAGLIYCATRAQTETVARHLAPAGVRVAAYHAGLPPVERAAIQQAFLTGDLDCVAATNAFGMGIDKPDVRWLVHFAHPGSLEAYYQEVGRVGRDGAAARCMLFYSPHDVHVHRQFIREACPPVDRVLGTFRRVRARASANGVVALPRAEHERLKHDLFLLERVGLVAQEWRRGHRAAVHLRVQACAVPADAPTGRAREAWAALDDAFDLTARGSAGPADLLGRMAATLDRPAADVEQALYDLDVAGLIAYRPADGAVLYRVLEGRASREQARAVGELVALRRRLRTGRLDAVRRFAGGAGCLRDAVLRHFSGSRPVAPCGGCGGCAPQVDALRRSC